MADRVAKMVIVMRKDLNMRKGKMIAQGAHASTGLVMGIFLDHKHHTIMWNRNKMTVDDSAAITAWDSGAFTKITVGVSSEEELMRVYAEAIKANLPVKMITDAGQTEFHGIPTRTCLAIGPAWNDRIDPITGDLPLL